jgi:hypothetical protein
VEEIVGDLRKRAIQHRSAGILFEELEDFGDQPGIPGTGGLQVLPPFGGGALGSLVE